MIQLLILEFGLVLLSVVLAFLAPRLGGGMFGALERRFAALARRKTLAVVVVGIAAAIAGAIPRIVQGLPRPQKHDEFSYLLAADTFAHGRLTNPTHPRWKHVETVHILQQPTYMSMYPPGQGMTLAFGQALFGHPWFGVWVSSALMCALICWALQAWLPPTWALFGGFLAIARISTFSYWVGDYHGGTVACVGGSLMLGALPRFLRRRDWRSGTLFALGLAIVANSRPFEGFAMTAAIGGIFIWSLFRAPFKGGKPIPVLAFAPMAGIVLVAAAAMMYYDWRITGSPLLRPYDLNRSQYAVANLFVWEGPKPTPVYRHEVMRDFYTNWEMIGFNLSRGWGGWEAGIYERIFRVWFFYVGPLLTIALFPLGRVIKDKRLRLLTIIAAFSFVILSTAIFISPHYVAPYTALFYAILLQGLRHVRQWRFRAKAVGLGIMRAIPVICLVLIGFRAAAEPLHWSLLSDAATWSSYFTPDYLREDVIARLKRMGGTAPDHRPLQARSRGSSGVGLQRRRYRQFAGSLVAGDG